MPKNPYDQKYRERNREKLRLKSFNYREQDRTKARIKSRMHYHAYYQRNKDSVVRFRLFIEDRDHLRIIARRQNVSVTELIRTYITWGLENDMGY